MPNLENRTGVLNLPYYILVILALIAVIIITNFPFNPRHPHHHMTPYIEDITWTVKGLVSNSEDYPIKGYVQIQFLNSQGELIASRQVDINKGKGISPKNSCPFESCCPKIKKATIVKLQPFFESI